ncbi:MAG: TraX family protein [Candidatus Bathyarchaeia archaeon]
MWLASRFSTLKNHATRDEKKTKEAAAAHYDLGREALKWIALATMTVDHVGSVLYPELELLRVIGRISFPIYSYLIVLGVETTRSFRKYLTRLLIFAFISQAPYFLAHRYGPFESLNIYFTLAFGALSLRSPIMLILALVISFFLNFDYGPYGIALISAMQLLRTDQRQGIAFIVLLNAIFYLIWDKQVFSLFAVPLIVAHLRGFLGAKGNTHREGSTFPTWRKYLFYVYYPAHLTVLVLIRRYLTGTW